MAELVDIYIIIVNYNNWKDSIECVESLINSEFKNFQILLLDNFSSNDSVAQLYKYLNGDIPDICNDFFKNKIPKRSGPLSYKAISAKDDSTIEYNLENASPLAHPLLFFKSDTNWGFAGGNNMMLNYIIKLNNKKEIPDDAKIFLLNPDTFLDFKALGILNNVTNEYFIAACQIRSYDEPDTTGRIGACRYLRPTAQIRPIRSSDESIDYIYGGALLTNVSTVRKNGLLPEHYFHYWEETDWCYRAKQKDIPFIICENAIVYDKVGGSIGKGSKMACYYNMRNGLLFYKIYQKKLLPVLFLVNVCRFISYVLRLQFEKANGAFWALVDYIKGKSGYKLFKKKYQQ